MTSPPPAIAWGKDPFGAVQDLLSIRPGATGLSEEVLRQLPNIAASFLGGNVRNYLERIAPERAYVERYLRRRLEPLVLEQQSVQDWLKKWSDHQPPAIPGAAPVPHAEIWQTLFAEMHRRSTEKSPWPALPTALSKAISAAEEKLLNSNKLYEGYAGTLATMRSLLERQRQQQQQDLVAIIRSQQEILTAMRNIGSVLNVPPKFYESLTTPDAINTFVRAIYDAVASKTSDLEKQKNFLRGTQDSITTINDMLQLPLTTETGTMAKPFSTVAITRTQELLTIQWSAWQALLNRDSNRFRKSLTQVLIALRSMAVVLLEDVQPEAAPSPLASTGRPPGLSASRRIFDLDHRTIVADPESASNQLNELQRDLSQAASTRRRGLEELRRLLDTAVTTVSETLASSGSSVKFRRDQAANAEAIVRQALAQSDEDLQQLYLAVVGTINAIMVISSAYRIPDPDMSELNKLIDSLAKLTAARVEQRPGTGVTARSTMAPPARSGGIDTQALQRWLAAERGESGSIATTQQQLASLRATLSALENQRTAGERRLAELDRSATEVVRLGFSILGPGASYDRSAASSSVDQVQAAFDSRNVEFNQRMRNVRATIAALQKLLRVFVDPDANLHKPGDTLMAGGAFEPNSKSTANYLVRRSVQDIQMSQDALAVARSQLANADAKRRVAEQRLDLVQRDASAMIIQELGALGKRVSGSIPPTQLQNEVDNAVSLWGQEQSRRIERTTGTLSSLARMAQVMRFIDNPDSGLFVDEGRRQLTVGQAIESLGNEVTGFGTIATMIDKGQDYGKKVEILVSNVSNLISKQMGTLRVGTKSLEDMERNLKRLVDEVLQQARSLFPGSTVLSTAGTVSERLNSILNQTAVVDYNRLVEEINKYKSSLENAATVLGITGPQMPDLAPVNTDVLWAISAGQPVLGPGGEAAITVDPRQQLETARGYTAVINERTRKARSLVDLLKKQAREIKEAASKVSVEQIQTIADAERRELNATYNTAVTVYLAACSAYLKGNRKPLINATSVAFSQEARAVVTQELIQTFQSTANLSAVAQAANWFAQTGFFDRFVQAAPAIQTHVLEHFRTTTGQVRDPIALLRSLLLDNVTYQGARTITLPQTDPTLNELNDFLQRSFPGIAVTYEQWLTVTLRYTVGILMSVPAIVVDVSDSLYAYEPTSDTSLMMLLARQLANSARGKTTIGEQRLEMERQLAVVQLAADMHVKLSPDTILGYSDEIAKSLSDPLSVVPSVPLQPTPSAFVPMQDDETTQMSSASISQTSEPTTFDDIFAPNDDKTAVPSTFYYSDTSF